MPRFLALEWDAREARVAVARTRGSDIVIEHAFTVPLDAIEGQTRAESEVGKRVAAELAARNLGRTETLVAVGRTNIELRQLALPPSPVEELPELVRFQALRQFTTIDEEWPIDFVHVDSGESESLHVIAAAISPELVKQIQATCESAELTAKRLILRPFAAASLLHRHDKNRNPPCTLMVDLLAEEADLTVMVDNQVAMMRTVRMSTGPDADAQSRALLGEIRRTIAAAQNQLSGHRVERIVLCGDGSEQSTLKTLVEDQLSYSVELFDPFNELQVESELARSKPQHPGRFAPLLGMLADEATGTAHAIDFLHPREKPKPANPWRSNGLYIGLGVAVCAAIVLLLLINRWNLDARIADLREESQGLNKTVTKAKKKADDVNRVEEFLQSDFAWLDELKGLSDTLPPAENVILTQLNMIVIPGGGQLSLDGYAAESSEIEVLQRALRAGGRPSSPKGGGIDERRDEFKWHFKEVVILKPRTDLTANMPAAKNVAAVEPDPAASEPPVTEAPGTEAPVTEAPVTEAPVTEAPVTEAPVTEAPVTEAPASDPVELESATPVAPAAPAAAPAVEPAPAAAPAAAESPAPGVTPQIAPPAAPPVIEPGTPIDAAATLVPTKETPGATPQTVVPPTGENPPTSEPAASTSP